MRLIMDGSRSMDKIFTEEELLKMRAIYSFGLDITNNCYQLFKNIESLKHFYILDPNQMYKYEQLINELMNYITETVIEKYAIENKQKQ